MNNMSWREILREIQRKFISDEYSEGWRLLGALFMLSWVVFFFVALVWGIYDITMDIFKFLFK